MNKDLTRGPITKSLIMFTVPIVMGNFLQQLYNIVDTIIVGKYLGQNALAAVGSSYTLMVFITSIILGLCMGSGALFSILYGKKDEDGLRRNIAASFIMILIITLIITVISYLLLDYLKVFLNVPDDVWWMMKDYLIIIFAGIFATFLYNYFACYLRSLGNSKVPLYFLSVSAVVNVILDLYFIIGLDMGVKGAAYATFIAQYISGIGIMIYVLRVSDEFKRISFSDFDLSNIKEISSFSFLTCLQQSVMNLGILMVQGVVNSFGSITMAAFATAVKIDSFAYMPSQDFGNAFSTFIAQNHGARKDDRIKKGIKIAFIISSLFCIMISILVFVFAKELMMIFVKKEEVAVIAQGVRYLRIEGVFYIGIGWLFLLYGLYRAIEKPGMSVVLTIISLGTRVVLAYVLTAVPEISFTGIPLSIIIGWILADVTGIVYYLICNKRREAYE